MGIVYIYGQFGGWAESVRQPVHSAETVRFQADYGFNYTEFVIVPMDCLARWFDQPSQKTKSKSQQACWIYSHPAEPCATEHLIHNITSTTSHPQHPLFHPYSLSPWERAGVREFILPEGCSPERE
jgi:hypothetical protein